MKKLGVILSLVLVLSLGVTAVAFAQEAPDARIGGRGRLWARGAGYAEVHGDGRVDVKGHGVGTVRVSGAERIRTWGQGRRQEMPDGSILFSGWRGRIHLAGQDLNVQMAGGQIEFTAQGRGWVFLQGSGVYRANGWQGRWTSEGVRIELGRTTEAR